MKKIDVVFLHLHSFKKLGNALQTFHILNLCTEEMLLISDTSYFFPV